MAPAVGFEPTTNRLTADRSTTELRWIKFLGPNRGHTVCPENQERQVPFQICEIDLVAGAGFEPAVPQARDYEPNRDRPVIR
jgi:hypothetical protein